VRNAHADCIFRFRGCSLRRIWLDFAELGAGEVAYLWVFKGGGLEMKVRRKRAVTRAARRRIVRDLILAIVAAVGVVVAFEILMRILGRL
jgi:hypothetical protein